MLRGGFCTAAAGLSKAARRSARADAVPALARRLVPTPAASMQARYHRPAPTGGDMVDIHFKLRDGSRKTVSVTEGTSVLEAAHQNEIELEGACEASLACSTCHVILPQDVYDRLPEITDKEEDLLDLAPCLTSTSRLGCQVIVDKSLAGIEVELPRVTVNFYVDGFVPTPH
mmetsp:Transcript_4003/g.9322  ORF Transcript_4003/g.9322 Transcript_4003/m.9322 type:complete len:172 (-) Transcript_4003:121-636(-)